MARVIVVKAAHFEADSTYEWGSEWIGVLEDRAKGVRRGRPGVTLELEHLILCCFNVESLSDEDFVTVLMSLCYSWVCFRYR